MWTSLVPIWLLLYRVEFLICKNSCVSSFTVCSWNSTQCSMEGVMYSGLLKGQLNLDEEPMDEYLFAFEAAISLHNCIYSGRHLA